MKVFELFRPREKTKVQDIINNDKVKGLVDQFIKEEMDTATSLVIIWEHKKETYWKCAGIEPAQAILTMDQLHHRIQHEGLKDNAY